MRQYVIDELHQDEHLRIKTYLENETQKGPVDGIYWLLLPPHLVDVDQHKDHSLCSPYYVSIELTENAVHFELLVRSKSTLHCTCIRYADQQQRSFLLTFIDSLIVNTEIKA